MTSADTSTKGHSCTVQSLSRAQRRRHTPAPGDPRSTIGADGAPSTLQLLSSFVLCVPHIAITDRCPRIIQDHIARPTACLAICPKSVCRLKFQTQNRGDGTLIPTVVGVDDVGGVVDNTFTTAHTQLTMDMTPDYNQTNIGAKLSFYCEKDDSWIISFRGSELGNGTINAGGLVPGTY